MHLVQPKAKIKYFGFAIASWLFCESIFVKMIVTLHLCVQDMVHASHCVKYDITSTIGRLQGVKATILLTFDFSLIFGGQLCLRCSSNILLRCLVVRSSKGCIFEAFPIVVSSLLIHISLVNVYLMHGMRTIADVLQYKEGWFQHFDSLVPELR